MTNIQLNIHAMGSFSSSVGILAISLKYDGYFLVTMTSTHPGLIKSPGSPKAKAKYLPSYN